MKGSSRGQATNKVDLVATKAEILCTGLRVDVEATSAIKKINPYITNQKVIHGANLVLGNDICMLACVSEAFSNFSEYMLKYKDGNFELYKKESYHCECDVIPSPNWYKRTTSDGVLMADILRQHGFNTLVNIEYSGCDFIQVNEQCLFCCFQNKDVPYSLKLKHISESIKAALEEKNSYQVGLSEGAILDPERGIYELSEVVKSIKQIKNNMEISVEIVPPEKDEHIDLLVDSGVTAMIMNLELFDDNIRKLFCPGKSKIEKERYFHAWQYAIERLGYGQVSSVLLVGLERNDVTIKAAEKMVEMGVIPTLIPFKPYDLCYLHNFSLTSPKDLLLISRKVAKLLNEYNLDPCKQGGCTACGGCSLEAESGLLCMHA